MSENKSKVIGEGTYGCVHHPPLLCKDNEKRDLDQVSKLMETNEANSEMNEYVLISNVDRNQNFYLGQPTLCKVGTQYSNKEAIKDCKIRKQVFDDYDDFSLMLMKNGGNSLKIFSQNMKNETVSESNKKKIQDFWVSCQKLFLGVKTFVQGDIVHHDVKHQNIVYHAERNESKFIDFGLMTRKSIIIEKLKKEGFWLTMFHWSFPLELGYLKKNGIKSMSKKTDSEKLQHIGKLIDEIKKYKNSSDLSKASKQASAFITFLNEVHCNDSSHYCTKTFENIMDDYLLTLKSINTKQYKKIVEKSYNTVDSYGLGLSLMYVLNRVNKFMDNEFAKQMGDLFYNMYHPNVQVRYDIGTSLLKYEQLMNKYILNKETKVFLNNKVTASSKSKKSIINEIKTTTSKDITISSKKTLDTLTVDPIRQCPEGKEMNPITKRCVKKCKDGYSRDAGFKCKKNLHECPQSKERNPLTKRCVKKCKDGYSRNQKFKCVKTRKIRIRNVNFSE